MVWGPTDSTSAPWTANTLVAVHTDIIVATTNQKSWDGATPLTRLGTGDTNYCDKIREDANSHTHSYTFKTVGGASASFQGLAGK